jgi:hypothetical protein
VSPKGEITVTRPAIIAAVIIAITLPAGARAQGSIPAGSSRQLGQASQTASWPGTRPLAQSFTRSISSGSMSSGDQARAVEEW